MKVFVTGASGFIGTAIVQGLMEAGHRVTGLARSQESAEKIRAAGAEVLMGDLQSAGILQQGVSSADGVIHTAFIHDFNQYATAGEIDKAAIHAMGEALMGTGKPMVVTAGILGLPAIDGVVTEESKATASLRSSETAALTLAEAGVNASVIRLPPSVHDKGDRGFIPFIIQQAKMKGISAYPDDGNNRWPAVHRQDAANLFIKALERSARGALYNAIGDNGIPLIKIAALIGEKLNTPLTSVSGDAMMSHFDWMSRFIAFDCPARAIQTQSELDWNPVHLGLLEDMRKNYF